MHVLGIIPAMLPVMKSLMRSDVTDMMYGKRLCGMTGVILISKTILNPLFLSPKSIALNSFILRVRCFRIQFLMKNLPMTKPITPPNMVEIITKRSVRKKPAVGPLNLVKIRAPPKTKKVVGMKKIVMATKIIMYKAIP